LPASQAIFCRAHNFSGVPQRVELQPPGTSEWRDHLIRLVQYDSGMKAPITNSVCWSLFDWPHLPAEVVLMLQGGPKQLRLLRWVVCISFCPLNKTKNCAWSHLTISIHLEQWLTMALPREDVEFKSCDGTTLRGWFYPQAEPSPCIIMSHGVSDIGRQAI
jgi:hypothetical protein